MTTTATAAPGQPEDNTLQALTAMLRSLRLTSTAEEVAEERGTRGACDDHALARLPVCWAHDNISYSAKLGSRQHDPFQQ